MLITMGSGAGGRLPDVGRVLATAPLERLVLLRDKEVVYTHLLPSQGKLDPRRVRVEVEWR
jgi:hypothetical protein